MLRKIAGKRNFLKIVFVIVAFVFILAGWLTKHYIFPYMRIEGQAIGGGNQENESYYNDLYSSDSGDVISNDNPYSAVILKNKYTVTGVAVEQELTSEESSAISDPSVNLNDSTMNGYRIVCVSVEIENQRDREELLTPNTNLIKVMSDDSSIASAEPFLMKPYRYSPISSQHFHLTLQSKEIVQMKLYYCIKNEYLNNAYTLQFYLNPSGLNEDRIPDPKDDPAKYFAKMNLNTFILK